MTIYDIGPVPVTLTEHDRTRTSLLLHGGAGPASVAAFGEFLAENTHTRTIIPTHPGFNGTVRPDAVATIRDLADLYAGLLDRLEAREVTVIGNSIGGWIAAEMALLGSPRVRAAVLIDAVGAEVAGHPVADVSTLDPAELRKLSFHDPDRFAPRAGSPAPDPKLVATNMAALAQYGGPAMADPTLLPRLAAATVPVHVIWGSADRIVTPDYGRAYAAAIPGARFTLLERAGHLPQIEAPQALLEAISG